MKQSSLRLTKTHRDPLESLTAWVTLVDGKGRVAFWNRGATAISGYPPEQVEGRQAFGDWLCPDPAQGAALKDRIERGEAFTGLETALRCRTGELKNVLWCGSPYLKRKKRVGMLLVGVAGARPRRAPDIVRGLERAVEQSIDGIALVDVDGRLQLMNRAWLRMHGYRQADAPALLGAHVGRFHTEEQRQKEVLPMVERVRKLGGQQGECGHRRRDGTTFRAWRSLTLVRDEAGEPIGFLSIARNISEQKRAEEAVRVLKKAVGRSLDGIAFTDPEGSVQYLNEAWIRMHGYHLPQESELVGQHLRRFHAEAERDGATERFFEEVRRQESYQAEVLHRRQDGTTFPVWRSLTAMTGTEGKILGLVEIARDVTELREAQERLARQAEELARSNEELQQFAYVASHDLQEPLRMVSSYVQLLSKRYEDRLGKDADEFIQYAVDGASRMRKLINDLLTYSRVGTRAKEFEPTDCGAVLDQVLQNLGAAIEESKAEIEVGPLPVIMGDVTQLIQLFQNLIGNAVKFRGETDPRVRVAAQRRGNEWLFSVTDNGIGIDPQFKERIFVIFQRLHNSPQYAGTGIGLSICKKIVERHGGRIWLESEPGAGCRFYFTLPMRGRRE